MATWRSPLSATVVLALCGMVASLQFTVIVPALAALPGILEVTANDATWIITVTLLTSTVATPILSRMADMYGKRRMIVIALVAMTLGSLIAAIGATFWFVIVGRALQGFAAATIPIGISLLRDILPAHRAGSAVALMSATLGIGSALGLPLSGVLFGSFGYTSLFWVGAVLGTLFAGLVSLFVAESPVRIGGRFDVLGAVVLSIALIAALLAISKASVWDVRLIIALLVLAAAVTAVWILYELRASQPMVDIRTCMRRPVLLTNIASFFTSVAMFANLAITPFQVQGPTASGYGFGLSVAGAGLVLVPSAIAMVVLSPLTGGLLDRYGGKPVLIPGVALMAAGFVGRGLFASELWQIVLGATVVGIGTALAFAAIPTLIMSSVPLTETASANGVNSLIRSFGTATCSASVALIVSAMPVRVGDEIVPSWEAIQAVFWIAAGCAVIAAVIATGVPAMRAHPRPSSPSMRETVLRGTIESHEGTVPRAATMTFMHLDGTPADWSRVDQDGAYSVVLPGPGRYLSVADAAGWAPRAEVVTVTDDGPRRHSRLAEQLSLQGVIRREGRAVPGATMALYDSQGECFGRVRSGSDGAYRLPLPAAGSYVMTVIGPEGEWAHSRKLAVGVDALDVEIAVPA